ncbi:hypothetical protein CJI97_003849 [Candidozyma auris]|nr:hypothetical protein CJI97_003849 [[Candida] auris]
MATSTPDDLDLFIDNYTETKNPEAFLKRKTLPGLLLFLPFTMQFINVSLAITSWYLASSLPRVFLVTRVLIVLSYLFNVITYAFMGSPTFPTYRAFCWAFLFMVVTIGLQIGSIVEMQQAKASLDPVDLQVSMGFDIFSLVTLTFALCFHAGQLYLSRRYLQWKLNRAASCKRKKHNIANAQGGCLNLQKLERAFLR